MHRQRSIPHSRAGNQNKEANMGFSSASLHDQHGKEGASYKLQAADGARVVLSDRSNIQWKSRLQAKMKDRLNDKPQGPPPEEAIEHTKVSKGPELVTRVVQAEETNAHEPAGISRWEDELEDEQLDTDTQDTASTEYINDKEHYAHPDEVDAQEDYTRHVETTNVTAQEARDGKAQEETDETELVQDFIQDNQTRYKKKKAIMPTPVLPIIVPDHFVEEYKMMLAKRKFREQSAKRQSTSSDDDEIDNRRAKRINTRGSYSSGSATENPSFFTEASGREDEHIPDYSASDCQILQGTENVLSGGYEVDQETYEESAKFEMEQERQRTQVLLDAPRQVNVPNWGDPMMVAEYEEEIFAHLRSIEGKTLVDSHYLDNRQHEITWRLRGVLVDWAIEVHYMYELLPETLYLCVNLIDRFLSRRTVAIGKMQLVGVTALWVAIKFEQISGPTLEQLIKMTDKSMTPADVRKAERYMLQVLEFELLHVNPLHFLRRLSCTINYEQHTHTLAKYFMEISCLDHRLIDTKASKIAAAAMWLSQRMLAKGQWTVAIARLAGYSAAELKSTVQVMLDFLSKPIEYEAFHLKWGSKRLMKASTFVDKWIAQCYR